MATEIESARYALEKIRRELNSYCTSCTLLDRMTEDPPDYTCLRDSLLEIERIVAAALALPRRNCEVGTAEEQIARFNEFCQSRYDPEAFDGVIPTGCKCPCQYADGCNQFIWAQMPYEAEKGGAE